MSMGMMEGISASSGAGLNAARTITAAEAVLCMGVFSFL
jgi:hypothetical protein